ncbi:ATP-dependent zinc protease family protein [Arthrospiribacter ruber]|uniref:ATP-dependent zinc protease n=1 Tax=Arthrospiribacter ruber TaxID=2487934 RepID=A0A951MIQ3_9BACT|nr:RimK/LysX family protein [Arthrospiribacter ruber]MBW3470410.1 ATP-dependent zinc protease [Arthrospiribacter ruber]
MKKTIGRREKISLPEWGLNQITAKIDTGAYTSSIHCESVEELSDNEGKYLEFQLLEATHRRYQKKKIKTRVYTQKKVKNSFGQAEIRYKVSTDVLMFGEIFQAEFTLTDRSKMKNPILLGRKLLQGRFIVDVEEVNLSKKSLK